VTKRFVRTAESVLSHAKSRAFLHFRGAGALKRPGNRSKTL